MMLDQLMNVIDKMQSKPSFFSKRPMSHTFYYGDGSVGVCKDDEELKLRRESSSWFRRRPTEVVE